MQYTPYIPAGVTTELEQVRVNWSARDSVGREEIAERFHQISEVGNVVYNASFIDCQHPEGKWWKSLFIPINRSGTAGLSITWWGKDLKVKGQVQVKKVSEKEWYTVVKSKAVGKEYEVLNYIGRYVPVDGNHGFVYDIAQNPEIPKLPTLGFELNAASDLIGKHTVYGLGREVGSTLANTTPIRAFIDHITAKNLDANVISEAGTHSSTLDETNIINGLMEKMFGNAPEISVAAPPVPKVDRSEVYGSGWGGFA